MANSQAKVVSSILEKHGYQLGRYLGKGAYAIVWEAYFKKWKTNVAVKVLLKEKAEAEFLSKFLPREIQVWKTLKHPNLVSFYQSIETTNRVYIMLELAPGGEVMDRIRMKGPCDESLAGKWFEQLCQGMAYIHSCGVVHRDLKLENLLLDKNENIKISDFGFCKVSAMELDGGKQMQLSETYCGSYAYVPPEVLQGIPYNPFLSDVWSMGVILFTMVTGKLPFDDSNLRRLLKQMLRGPIFTNRHKTISPRMQGPGAEDPEAPLAATLGAGPPAEPLGDGQLSRAAEPLLPAVPGLPLQPGGAGTSSHSPPPPPAAPTASPRRKQSSGPASSLSATSGETPRQQSGPPTRRATLGSAGRRRGSRSSSRLGSGPRRASSPRPGSSGPSQGSSPRMGRGSGSSSRVGQESGSLSRVGSRSGSSPRVGPVPGSGSASASGSASGSGVTPYRGGARTGGGSLRWQKEVTVRLRHLLQLGQSGSQLGLGSREGGK